MGTFNLPFYFDEIFKKTVNSMTMAAIIFYRYNEMTERIVSDRNISIILKLMKVFNQKTKNAEFSKKPSANKKDCSYRG